MCTQKNELTRDGDGLCVCEENRKNCRVVKERQRIYGYIKQQLNCIVFQ